MAVSAVLDAHKEKCNNVILDENGEVLKDGKFDNSLSGVESFFGDFKHAEEVIEASYFWRPTYERLEEMGIEPKVAHPDKVWAIAEAEVKTDSIDVRTLVHLLEADLISEPYFFREGQGASR